MEIQTFEFMPGAVFQAGAVSDPVAVGERIELLRKQHGGDVTAEIIVADARHNNSPLHSFFEWDDTAAAEQFRLNQARRLIRTVVAVYKETRNDEPIKSRAYVHVRHETDSDQDRRRGTYREMTEALSVTSTRTIVLQNALADIKAWKKKYGDLQELAAIVKEIVKVEDKISENA